jgi:hypothetical protein
LNEASGPISDACLYQSGRSARGAATCVLTAVVLFGDDSADEPVEQCRFAQPAEERQQLGAIGLSGLAAFVVRPPG